MSGIDTAEDEIDAIVEAYEDRVASTGHADLVEFLPDADHPLYADALRELVRVDLEFAWRAGMPRRVESYLERFPALRDDTEALAAIGYEECRQRRRIGERPSAAEYVERFGVAPRDDEAPEEESADPMTNEAAQYLKCGLSTAKEPNTQALPDPGAPAPTQLFAALHRADPKKAVALAEALTHFPEAGTTLHEFHLEGELGRGAFGRVYIARQADLAGRPVVVKLTADGGAESQALARLQHTNIVPVYAVHRWKPHHAIIMPFCGGTTLFNVVVALRANHGMPTSGRWLVDLIGERALRFSAAPSTGGMLARLAKLNYEQAIVDLAARLAGGLAHAHDRGIVHRDLKPANVLLADDGEPMLLDFNLAQDARLGGRPEGAQVGGTLPYMAPEQLLGFESMGPQGDARGDVYAFGLVLFELLTGHLPCPTPTGPVMEICRQLRQLRLQPPPRMPGVRPALEAIVRKCLAPDPRGRYPSARELADDLERQRDDLPLQYAGNPSMRERIGKWARRNPRLTSGYAVAAMAVVVLSVVGAFAIHQRSVVVAAREQDADREFHRDLGQARVLLATAYPQGQTLLRGLAAATAASDERNRRREGYVEALLARSRAERMAAHAEPDRKDNHLAAAMHYVRLAEEAGPDSEFQRAILLQRAFLEDSPELYREAIKLPSHGSRDEWLTGLEQLAAGRFQSARKHFDTARHADPRSVAAWSALGQCHLGLGEPDRATTCFETAIALEPECGEYRHWLGMAHYHRGDYPAAVRSLEVAARLVPGDVDVRADLGMAKFAAGDSKGAISDLTMAIESGDSPVKVHFARSKIYRAAGDQARADADLTEGFRRTPITEMDWAARALARLPADPSAALADLERGLRVMPESRMLLENLAYVAEECLHRPDDAIKAFDRLLEINPDSAKDYAGRGVVHARQQHKDLARKDAVTALKLSNGPDVVYQVAGIYALLGQQTPADREQAIFLLTEALHRGYGLQHIDRDADLTSIRDLPEVRKVIAGVRRRHS